MKIDFDVDIDCANRDRVLKHMKHIPASIAKDGKLTKHNSGVYFQNIPTEPLAGYASIDHKVVSGLLQDRFPQQLYLQRRQRHCSLGSTSRARAHVGTVRAL